MKKIVIYTMFCLLILLLPSMTVGMSVHENSEEKPATFGWTYLQGIIINRRFINVNGGDYVTFQAVLVHYTTHWFGNIRSGFFHRLETIILPEFHFGFLGHRFVFAKFNAGLIP